MAIEDSQAAWETAISVCVNNGNIIRPSLAPESQPFSCGPCALQSTGRVFYPSATRRACPPCGRYSQLPFCRTGNGNGMARWITVPETSEIRYTSGGRTRPRFATSGAALEAPPCCGVVVIVFGLQNRSIDYGAPNDLTVQRSARSDVAAR